MGTKLRQGRGKVFFFFLILPGRVCGLDPGEAEIRRPSLHSVFIVSDPESKDNLFRSNNKVDIVRRGRGMYVLDL